MGATDWKSASGARTNRLKAGYEGVTFLSRFQRVSEGCQPRLEIAGMLSAEAIEGVRLIPAARQHGARRVRECRHDFITQGAWNGRIASPSVYNVALRPMPRLFALDYGGISVIVKGHPS